MLGNFNYTSAISNAESNIARGLDTIRNPNLPPEERRQAEREVETQRMLRLAYRTADEEARQRAKDNAAFNERITRNAYGINTTG